MLEKGNRIKNHFLPFLFYAIVVLIVTFPVSLFPFSLVLGHPNNDIWNHLWGFWWVKESIVIHGRFPFSTSLLNYPYGGHLYFIDTANAFLSIPFQILFNLPFAYNFVLFLSLFISAYGAYLLSLYIVKDRTAGLITGIIYGFTPHILGQIDNGITETVNTGFIPLFMLFFLMTIEERRRKHALLAGLFLSLAIIFNFYYGIFCIFSGILILIYHSIAGKKKVFCTFLVRNIGIILLVTVILTSPLLYIFYLSITSQYALVTRDIDFVYSSLIRHNITDIIAFFHTGKFYSPDLHKLYGEDLVIIVYTGWIGIILSFLCLITVRQRIVRFWAIFGIFFFILSLGPYLYVNGKYVEIDGKWIPLPFLIFFKSFPIFSRISHPFRFSIMVNLSIGIMSAILLHLNLNVQKWLKVFLTILLSVIILWEYLFVSPVRYPLPYSRYEVPKIYHKFAEMKEDFAVLDIPICIPNLKRAIYCAYQTVSKKKIPYGLNIPYPNFLRKNSFTNYLTNVEVTYSGSIPLELPYLDLLVALDMLRENGFKYIVVHNSFYLEKQREKVNTLLDLFFDESESYPEDEVKVYKLY